MKQSPIAASPISAKLSRSALPLCFCVLSLFTVCSSCVKFPRSQRSADDQSPVLGHSTTPASAVHLNTASLAELEKLPGVGAGIAGRIIEHREKFGPFRRVEHVLIVRGISESRFRQMRPFITAE